MHDVQDKNKQMYKKIKDNEIDIANHSRDTRFELKNVEEQIQDVSTEINSFKNAGFLDSRHRVEIREECAELVKNKLKQLKEEKLNVLEQKISKAGISAQEANNQVNNENSILFSP